MASARDRKQRPDPRRQRNVYSWMKGFLPPPTHCNDSQNRIFFPLRWRIMAVLTQTGLPPHPRTTTKWFLFAKYASNLFSPAVSERQFDFGVTG